MYKLIKDQIVNAVSCVFCFGKNTLIPFDPANRDFAQFKTDIASGTPLEDPDGNVMTQAQVDTFLKEIP